MRTLDARPGWSRGGRALAPSRADLLVALASTCVVLGMFLDGRAHKVGGLPPDDGFLSPWHGLLYAGFAMTAGLVVRSSGGLAAFRAEGRAAVPAGYGLALFAIPAFLASGFMDLLWHSAFGFEDGLEAGMSPPHLGLFLSGALLITAPLRSAWHQGTARAMPTDRFLPATLSLGIAMATVVSWLNVFLEPLPWGPLEGSLAVAREVDEKLTLEVVDSLLFAKQLLASAVLTTAVVLVMKRWRPPTGTFTIALSITAALNYMEDDFAVPGVFVGMVAGGIAVDLVLRLVRGPARHEVMLAAGVLPFVTWSAYFAAVALSSGLRWPHQMWSGCILLTTLIGVSVAMVATVPVVDAER